MKDIRTLLFYLLSVASLIIVSILFTDQIEQPEVESLQPDLVISTVTKPKSTANLSQTDQEVCSSSHQIAFYRPDLSHLGGNHLVISGTVYASDFVTPLPSAPIEVSLVVKESYYPLYHTFHEWFQTDEAGYYEATIPKPGRHGIIYLHYRANDQDDCPLTLQLFLIDAVVISNTAWVLPGLMKLDSGQRSPTGLILRAPIDIALPVPTSEP